MRVLGSSFQERAHFPLERVDVADVFGDLESST
jgi:hypothetical protein